MTKVLTASPGLIIVSGYTHTITSDVSGYTHASDVYTSDEKGFCEQINIKNPNLSRLVYVLCFLLWREP